jgi:hypothetical protein
MFMIFLDGTVVNMAIGSGGPTAAALTGGYRLAFGIGAALVAAAIFVAATVLKPERQAKAELDEYELNEQEEANTA